MLSRINNLLKTQTLKDSGVSLIGNSLGAVFTLITIILLGRVLSQEDFGIYTSFKNFFLLGALLDFGYSQWLVAHLKSAKTSDESQKTSKAVSLSLITAGIAALLLLSLSPLRLKLIGSHNLLLYLVTIFGIVIAPLYKIGVSVFQARLDFIRMNIAFVAYFLSRLIILIIIYSLFGLSSLSVATIHTFAFLLVIIYLYQQLNLSITIKIPSKASLSKVFKFSSWLGLNQIIITLYGRVNILLLTFYYTAKSVAVYGAADHFAAFFPAVTASLASVAAPRFARFNHQKDARVYALKFFLFSVLISVGFLVVALFAKPIITLAFASKYQNAIPILRVLALANIPLLLSLAPVNKLIFYHKNTKIIFYTSSIQLITLFAFSFYWLPQYTLLAPAYALLIANTVGFIMPLAYLWLKT